MGKIEHYLITLDLCPAPYRMHSYLMTNDRECVAAVVNKMCNAAESEGFKIMLPVILQTKLADGVTPVREVVAKLNPKIKNLFATASDFHCSIFMLRAEIPEDKILMDLH